MNEAKSMNQEILAFLGAIKLWVCNILSRLFTEWIELEDDDKLYTWGHQEGRELNVRFLPTVWKAPDTVVFAENRISFFPDSSLYNN